MATEFVIWDTSILHDRKIRDLIRDNGYEGLGVYFAICTAIRKCDKGCFDLNTPDKSYLLDEMHVTERYLKKWLDILTKHELFDPECFESGQVTSERMLKEYKKQFSKSQKCSEAGKRSGEARREKSQANQRSTDA